MSIFATGGGALVRVQVDYGCRDMFARAPSHMWSRVIDFYLKNNENEILRADTPLLVKAICSINACDENLKFENLLNLNCFGGVQNWT